MIERCARHVMGPWLPHPRFENMELRRCLHCQMGVEQRSLSNEDLRRRERDKWMAYDEACQEMQDPNIVDEGGET